MQGIQFAGRFSVGHSLIQKRGLTAYDEAVKAQEKHAEYIQGLGDSVHLETQVGVAPSAQSRVHHMDSVYTSIRFIDQDGRRYEEKFTLPKRVSRSKEKGMVDSMTITRHIDQAVARLKALVERLGAQ